MQFAWQIGWWPNASNRRPFWVKPKDCNADAQILQVGNLTVKKTRFKQACKEVNAYQRYTQNLIFTDL